MKVYISGPMTGLPGFNFPAFNTAARRLASQGHKTVNPANKGIVDGWEWSDYLRHDVRLLTECDAIYLLHGWRDSRGARLEEHIARELGMQILDSDQYSGAPILSAPKPRERKKPSLLMLAGVAIFELFAVLVDFALDVLS
jgi:hypothetical protein